MVESLAGVLGGNTLQELRLQDVVALQDAPALIEHREQPVRAVDVTRQDDDKVALPAQIVGKTPPIGLIERG